MNSVQPEVHSGGVPGSTTPAKDDLLFVTDLAARIRRSPAQVRWMLNQGTAPKHAKIAGRICFRTSDVEAWITSAFEQAS